VLNENEQTIVLVLSSSTMSITNDQQFLAEDDDGDDISDGGELRVACNAVLSLISSTCAIGLLVPAVMLIWSALPIEPLVPVVTMLPLMVNTRLKVNTSFLQQWMLPGTGGLPLPAPLTDSKKVGAGGKQVVARSTKAVAGDVEREAAPVRLRDTSSWSTRFAR